MQLTDVEWKTFKVKELFEIEKCKCSNASKLIKTEDIDAIPYVGATNRNNGTIHFVKRDESLITKGECIVFVCDGQGSVGYSFYKNEDFIGSTTLKVGRNKNLNKYNSLFITAALDKNRELYSYGYKRNENRLKNEVIYLPATEYGTPNFEFMEQYAKEIERTKKEIYSAYVQKQMKYLEYKPLQKLEEKLWMEFRIYDIFSHKRGKRQTESSRRKGDIPYYSASQNNNGLTDFISNPTFIIKTNAIIYSTFGDAYYVNENFSSSDEITILTNSNINKYTGLFIVTCLNQNKSKYSFGRKAFSNKITKDKIMLPIDSLGNPDFEYMEQYIKNIILTNYQGYKTNCNDN